MEEVAAKSNVVFYGEVIGAEKIGKIVPSGEMQQYKITIYPQVVYKGKPRSRYVFKGAQYYNDADKDEVAVGGCSLDVALGGKYVIFIEKGKKVEWDWCSEHILPKETKKYEHFIQNIRPGL
ncbi:MAG TPA: hypothetical protein PK129_05110 [Cellvibrionaceae bacterium]|nr:hypothetical protein [Cellvibrionaceae bacterium]